MEENDKVSNPIETLNKIMISCIPTEYKENYMGNYEKICKEILSCHANILDVKIDDKDYKIIKKDFISEEMYKSLAIDILEIFPFINMDLVNKLSCYLYGIKTSLIYYEWESSQKDKTFESYKNDKYIEERIIEKIVTVGELAKKPCIGDQPNDNFIEAGLEIKRLLPDIVFFIDKESLLGIQSILISLFILETSKLEGKNINV